MIIWWSFLYSSFQLMKLIRNWWSSLTPIFFILESQMRMLQRSGCLMLGTSEGPILCRDHDASFGSLTNAYVWWGQTGQHLTDSPNPLFLIYIYICIYIYMCLCIYIYYFPPIEICVYIEIYINICQSWYTSHCRPCLVPELLEVAHLNFFDFVRFGA